MKKVKIAIAGNPNTGKTTVFNNLTGGRQSVGNYPGVTVEKRTGTIKHRDYELELVDLPGTYNLSAWSLDEKVARDFIVDELPDIVVNIIDSSNLERNLYLTTQFMELGLPMVLGFNMSDVAKANGVEFDLHKLSERFAAPVVSLVGRKDEGTEDLLDAIVDVAIANQDISDNNIQYGHDIEDEVLKLSKLVQADKGLIKLHEEVCKTQTGIKWLCIKLLEHDRVITEQIQSEDLRFQLEVSQEQLEELFGDSSAILIADKRYGFISGACQEAVRNTVEIRHTISDKVDVVLTHRTFGIPIFLLFMFGVFTVTFEVGDPVMALLESLFAWLSSVITELWPAETLLPLRSLIVDGIIGGVGGVLVFLPNIMLLFLAIAILEYSGYMARAAFVMDRLMHKIGLHGKSFIPMLIGFGCSVPAIMATRTLDSKRDRILTMMIIPFMSCGARLTIYMLIVPAFFPSWAYAPVIWLIYLAGIIFAVITAKLLGMTVLKSDSDGMVMELPPYRIPTFKCVMIHMWERAWLYLKKAGTLILGISILMWVLTNYPQKHDINPAVTELEAKAQQMEYSVAGKIGRFIEPAIRPMGFDWKIGTALIGAVAAKEVFVSQMGVVYSVEDTSEGSDSLREILREKYSPLIGLCVMIFCLIGFPCGATVAVTKSESGSWRWACLQFVGLTVMAYIVTIIVYQLGVMIGF